MLNTRDAYNHAVLWARIQASEPKRKLSFKKTALKPQDNFCFKLFQKGHSFSEQENDSPYYFWLKTSKEARRKSDRVAWKERRNHNSLVVLSDGTTFFRVSVDFYYMHGEPCSPPEVRHFTAVSSSLRVWKLVMWTFSHLCFLFGSIWWAYVNNFSLKCWIFSVQGS